MSPEEVEAAVARGDKDPTLKAVMEFVTSMCAIAVGETTGFWTASTCNGMRSECYAQFVVAMEKAAPPPQEG
jgi:hypothetical protein